MSKNRKHRWREVSPTCHVTSCGRVEANLRGKWDAVLRYRERDESGKYQIIEKLISEHPRVRQAMMAVEAVALDVNKRKNIIISIDAELLK